jgi:phosphoribosylamine--glycine ligase
MSEKVLVIGGGGREDAIIWKLLQSPKLGRLYVAPGNGKTKKLAAVVDQVPIQPIETDRLLQFVQQNKIDLTIVGPEDPLALGIVNTFRDKDLRIFGPTKEATMLEASKAWAKNFMQEIGIPTATFHIFKKYEEALSYIRDHGAPIVVKASGLALGKGAYPCRTLEDAERALKEIMIDRLHGDAGNEVVVEKYLRGQEISIHAFADGQTAILMPTAQDHKPIFDGDKGPNTGGMGTFAPVPWVREDELKTIKQEIIDPTIKGLAQHGNPFVGCLYPGLMMTFSHEPMVLEFNIRFGDPETQSYMRLLKTDLLEIIDACVDGKLADLTIEWNPGFACCIVLASGGYPGKYEKGKLIEGIKEAEMVPRVVVFHAGTKMEQGKFYTSGGRVLGVTATGKTLKAALVQAYKAMKCIYFEGMQYRTDIGAKAL